MTDSTMVPLSEAPITYQTLVSLSNTPTVPKRYQGKPQDMLAAVLIGRELNIGPMESITELYLVDGRVSMSGKLMASLVQRHGHQLRTKFSAEQAEVEVWRKGDDGELTHMGTITFTKEDAERAGLWGSGAWKDYPQVMMGWRAISIACRFFFPECLTSVKYETSELNVQPEQMSELPNAVIVVDATDASEQLNAEGVAEVLDGEVVTESEDEGHE